MPIVIPVKRREELPVDRRNAASDPERIDSTPPPSGLNRDGTMAPHSYLDALNKALNADLMQWAGSDSNGTTRRRGRTLAALVLGATTVVGTTDDVRTPIAPVLTTTSEMPGVGAVIPAHFRPAPDRIETVARVLTNARSRVENGTQPAQAVATLALEIGRLQRDLAVRAPEGMEEWIGEAYASLEAVRRAVADVVVDEEEAPVVASALDRAAEILVAA